MNNLIKITMVGIGTSDAARPYARDILGRTFFPQNKDTELKVGMYAYFVETTQTKTRNDVGDLVDLAIPTKINQITATFADKAEAVAALVELSTVGMEVAAEVANQAKELKLTEETVNKLVAAAW